MRTEAEVDRARRLAAAGMSPGRIARATGIPRTTVRGWLSDPGYRPAPRPRTATIDVRTLPGRAYAYLLGLYLGDGHVAGAGRCRRLELKLDARYPGIVSDAAAALGAVLPSNAVSVRDVRGERCVAVSAWSTQWPTLLPQHGPGRKHKRRIVFLPWQRAITSTEAASLIRGLIHSDGCRYVATVRRRGREYRYVRYAFANRSDDIKAILCAHLDLLGIGWTRPNDKDIAVARRADVARLDEFVGPKR